jgi:hypothetical protein
MKRYPVIDGGKAITVRVLSDFTDALEGRRIFGELDDVYLIILP